MACIAAQDGTSTGPADAVGVGEGLEAAEGIGDGLSDEVAVALDEGDGLLCVTALEFEHPATTSKAATVASRTPTGI